jgi:hypothetical protein
MPRVGHQPSVRTDKTHALDSAASVIMKTIKDVIYFAHFGFEYPPLGR